MLREFSPEEAQRHNEYCERGWALTRGQLVLHDAEPAGRPGWFVRRRLAKAIACFERALAINPEGWSSIWAIGKIHQRLGDHRAAAEQFARAFALNPTQPDVAREAGMAALELGDGQAAVRYCRAAIQANPKDAGLVANLALACLLSGDVSEATEHAQAALQQDPGDAISQNILKLIQAVAEGRRPAPRALGDLR